MAEGGTVFNEALPGEAGGAEEARGEPGLLDEVLEVVFGEGELPLLLERAGAVGVGGELFGEDAADGGG